MSGGAIPPAGPAHGAGEPRGRARVRDVRPGAGPDPSGPVQPAADRPTTDRRATGRGTHVTGRSVRTGRDRPGAGLTAARTGPPPIMSGAHRGSVPRDRPRAVGRARRPGVVRAAAPASAPDRPLPPPTPTNPPPLRGRAGAARDRIAGTAGLPRPTS